MARVRCMMMQRDETLLLDAWLAWHGYLFGFENLVVFDNGSVSRHVVATLRQAERAGVDVRWQHRAESDDRHRGDHFRNVMAAWEASGDAYDFALPLDCHDFVATFSATGLACRRDAVHEALDPLVGERRALLVQASLVNVPGRPGFFRLDPSPRRFLPAHAAGSIDHDFRSATSRLEEGERSTMLTLLSFGEKPYAVARAQARALLAPHVDVDDAHALANHHGEHADLVPTLRMSDAEYRARFDAELLIGFPAFGSQLAALRIESAFLGAPVAAWRRVPHDAVSFVRPASGLDPFWFDGGAYLRDHADVAQAGWPAAFHYAWTGGHEGRTATEAEHGDAARG